MSSSAGKRWDQNRCLYGRQHRTTDCCQGLITSLYHCMQLHWCWWIYTGFHWLGDCTFLAPVSFEPLPVQLHQRCPSNTEINILILLTSTEVSGAWSWSWLVKAQSERGQERGWSWLVKAQSERGQERGCMQGVFMYGPSTKNITAASNTNCKSSSALTVLR